MQNTFQKVLETEVVSLLTSALLEHIILTFTLRLRKFYKMIVGKMDYRFHRQYNNNLKSKFFIILLKAPIHEVSIYE